MTRRVLLVDDEEKVLSALRRQLRTSFDIVTAVGGAEGLKTLQSEGPFAVVISDMRMPEMDGVVFLQKAEEVSRDTVRMMLTGNADQETAVKAVNEGRVFRFFTKPCSTEILAPGIEAALEQHRLITAERDLLQKTVSGSIKVLVDVVRLVDQDVIGDTELLRTLARDTAKALKLKNAWQVEMAATLAQIGKLTIPADVMAKVRSGEPLTDTEQDIVDRVPEVSRDLIGNIPRLETIGEIAYYQSKNFDGSGFPHDDKRGADIPLGARIVHIIVDLVDAAGSREPDEGTVAALQTDAGRYDPNLLRAVEQVVRARVVAAGGGGASHIATPLMAGLVVSGDRLAADIRTSDGRVLLAAGQVVNDAQIKKLVNLAKMKRVDEPIVVYREPQEETMRKAAG